MQSSPSSLYPKIIYNMESEKHKYQINLAKLNIITLHKYLEFAIKSIQKPTKFINLHNVITLPLKIIHSVSLLLLILRQTLQTRSERFDMTLLYHVALFAMETAHNGMICPFSWPKVFVFKNVNTMINSMVPSSHTSSIFNVSF